MNFAKKQKSEKIKTYDLCLTLRLTKLCAYYFSFQTTCFKYNLIALLVKKQIFLESYCYTISFIFKLNMSI